MPQKNDFVHLHVHSEFSLLDGAARIRDLLEYSKSLGMSSLALTDHGNMYGIVQFYSAAQEVGVKPIIGCELYVAPRTRQLKETPEDRSPCHLTVLAKDQQGYLNLIQLVSLASLEGFYAKPRVDKELLEKYREGLVVLSGCPKGEIPSLILEGKLEEAKEVAAWFKERYGSDYYIELQQIGIPETPQLLEGLNNIAKSLNIPLVATNDVHYVKKEDAYSQDVLLCIQTGSLLEQTKRMKLCSEEFYVKSIEEMEALFSDFPGALKSTVEIAEKCNFKLELGRMLLPNFEVPQPETTDTYLEKLVWEGIKKRYGVLKEGNDKYFIPPEVKKRVEHELRVIGKMGYAAYFLIVQDFINYSRSQGIQVGPGRGSAGGSIVAYATGITSVDPLKYGLIFERFLNPERISMPDIDIDFCFERREEVIKYVSQKYGQDHVAQIITFGTMAARAAIRDVGRVMNVPLPEVDRVAKMIPIGPDVDLASAIQTQKELRDLYENNPVIQNLLDNAKKLEGFSRHASVHAAGVVISKNPLTEYVPLQKLSDGQIVTQFPMGDLEKIGLLKMDFLGLRNLTMIAYAIEIIKKRSGIDIDIDKIPLDDHKTYSLLSRGDAIGVFQLESSGMRGLIKDLRPSCFEEIIALLALYRPGPLESGMVDDFIKRKHKQIEVHYELPQLEPILRETYGVILYQEQVMQIASSLAGYTMGEADELRRAMGKKKHKDMEKHKEKFVDGAVARGVSKHQAAVMFNLCAKFAGYGFNKSHSTCYAVISYQTAYLKANHPVDFMAALLTSVMGNTDKVSLYINEAQKMGIKVLLPDVNESERVFTVTSEGIRFGLSGIKNVGEGAIDSILKAREEGGKCTSLLEFCSRMDLRAVNKKVMESLIKSGAFDSLGQSRAYYLAIMEKTLDKANAIQKEKFSPQVALFDLDTEKSTMSLKDDIMGIEVLDLTPEELLRMEKDMLGLYISDHPLTHVAEVLANQVKTKIADLSGRKEGEAVVVGGLLTSCKKILTKKKQQMMIASLEDLSSGIGLVIFPRTYETFSGLLKNDAIVIIKGKINRDMRTDNYNIAVDSVEELEEEVERERKMHLYLGHFKDPLILKEIKDILIFHRGSDDLFLHIDGKVIQPSDDFKVNINPGLIEQLEVVVGKENVKVEFVAIEKEE
ncbi:MAG: DNA polymerase III subunit alpha [Candidatus Saganbacteria bacterium]|nr:DNA polymerase III subunit alpha [Candidatus Saganbacteria bacterium]